MKIKYKIIFAFMLLATVVLAFLCIITYVSTEKRQKDDFTRRLQNRALTVATLLFKLPGQDYRILSKIDSATTNLLVSENINIYNNRNERIYRFARKYADTVAIPLAFLNKARLEGTAHKEIGDQKSLVAIFYQKAEFPVVVAISAIDLNGWNNLAELRRHLLMSFAAGILLAIIAGWLFSIALLRPIIRISEKVNRISATNIENRLTPGIANDEWQQLTITFNNLLNRLQESFEMQGRFIANASHELFTPLTSISNQIDVTLRKKRSSEEYLKVLQSVREDAQQMIVLTQHLLNIASTSKAGSIQTEPVRIDELLMELPLKLQKDNSLYSVSVFFDELPDDEKLFTVNGSQDLLLSAFKNISENGCKYAPDNKVNISLSFIAQKIIILFTNKSNLLDSEEVGKIFQPFQRGSKVMEIKGYGLGLSLTRRIIQLHNGEIKAELSENGEVMISVILPSTY